MGLGTVGMEGKSRLFEILDGCHIQTDEEINDRYNEVLEVLRQEESLNQAEK